MNFSANIYFRGFTDCPKRPHIPSHNRLLKKLILKTLLLCVQIICVENELQLVREHSLTTNLLISLKREKFALRKLRVVWNYLQICLFHFMVHMQISYIKLICLVVQARCDISFWVFCEQRRFNIFVCWYWRQTRRLKNVSRKKRNSATRLFFQRSHSSYSLLSRHE